MNATYKDSDGKKPIEITLHPQLMVFLDGRRDSTVHKTVMRLAEDTERKATIIMGYLSNGVLDICLLLLLRKRSAHLEIQGFPMNTGIFLRGLKLYGESKT